MIKNYLDFINENKKLKSTDLLLEIKDINNDFFITTTFNNTVKEFNINDKFIDIIKDFNKIYTIIQKRQVENVKLFQDKIQYLSKLLINPFIDEIKLCEKIIILLPYDNLNICIDLLLFNDNYLFLEKPICYIINNDIIIKDKINIKSSVIIDDLTADPERGGDKVSKIIKNSKYFNINNEFEDIIKTTKNKDALIISTHGEVDNNNVDGIIVNDDKIGGSDVYNVSNELVYIDSCRQSLNLDFLLSFKKNHKVKFYLAPVVSNDAGDSSTLTLVKFFTNVKKNKTPILTLFNLKKDLFKFYNKKKLNLILVLNKSFCFRLYNF